MRPSAEHARILVVDEDPAFQLGLKTFLREYVGFEKVYTAQSGSEAVERILEDSTIDVVTLDYQMPGMTGIDVLEKLRYTLKRPVSFLMITGYPSDELEQTFHKCASPMLLTTHFLPKPIEFERLEPIVLLAHEEVCAAREVGLAQPTTEDVPEPTPETGLSELKARLEEQGTKLDEIERQVAGLRRIWRGDFLTFLLLAGFFYAGFHLGWFERLKPVGKDFIEKARIVLVGKPSAAGKGNSESATDASGTDAPAADDADLIKPSPKPVPPPPGQPPVNEGRPL